MSPPARKQTELQKILNLAKKRGDKNLSRKLIRHANRIYSDYRLAVITTLNDETKAIRQVFGRRNPLPYSRKTGLHFQEIWIEVDGFEVSCLHVQCPNMGNNYAAVAAAVLLERYETVEDIILCGIAGGVPDPVTAESGQRKDGHPNHVRLGDIVISNSPIVQYDYVKMEETNVENRQIPIQVSPTLRSSANDLAIEMEMSEFDFDTYCEELSEVPDRPTSDNIFAFETDDDGKVTQIKGKISHPKNQKGRTDGRPMLHMGKIGSANVLLKNSKKRDLLKEKDELLAIEMEGAGISDASWTFGAGYFVVRGIVDYCDNNKNDDWRSYASYIAAAYTRLIAERYARQRQI